MFNLPGSHSAGSAASFPSPLPHSMCWPLCQENHLPNTLKIPFLLVYAFHHFLDWSIPAPPFPALGLLPTYLAGWESLVAQMVKNLPAIQETQVRSLGWVDTLEEEMATHSIILACRIPWTEEPGGLQSMGSQRVRHDWLTNTTTL